jgi:hypothetical protein
MTEWDGCYCGEFAQPTIAPDEYGETCFHEHDKCEVPTTKVPDQTVIRLLKQKVDAQTGRARKAEAAIQAVRELHSPYTFRMGDVRCSECFSSGEYAPWPCDTIKALDSGRHD